MISEKLAAVYTKLEDKYFNVLDFLDHKGIPAYAYSDFFENRGIPSLVVSIAIIVAVLVLLSLLLVNPFTSASEMVLNLKDASGNSIQGVTVQVLDAQGNVLFGPKKMNDGDKITLPGNLAQGSKIRVLLSKDGYQPRTEEFIVGKDNISGPKTIFLSADFKGIDAALYLTDAETQTKISGAVVLVTYNDVQYKFVQDGNGAYRKSGVPENTALMLEASADGYNPLKQEVTFIRGAARSFSMTPANAGYAGKASVVIAVSDESGQAISGALVRVFNKESQVELMNDVSVQGSVAGQIQTGIPLQILAEKEGYLNYDSDKEGTSLTIREKEKQIPIVLRKGGEKLTVNVLNQNGLALDGAVVQIFDLQGNRVARELTTLDGAVFTGLDSSMRAYVTAYKEGYLPGRQEIAVGSTESVQMVLREATGAKAVRLDIYAIDKMGGSVGGATVKVYEYAADGNMLAVGFDDLVTNVAGYVNAVFEANKTYELDAETEIMEGKKSVEVKEGTEDNKAYIEMKKKAKIVEMKFVDVYGNNVYGTAAISGLDGATLYDGNISNSRAYFNAETREVVEVQVTLADGNLFTENVTVKGKDYVEVTVYNKSASELAPAIEYVGVETEGGEEAKGITPGAFYWAKFNVSFPLAATKAGVHFRAGNDSAAFAESDTFALYELSLQGAETFYSTSYSPAPLPGDELADRGNAGTQGEPNKWVEGTLAAPKGTFVAKVRVRAADFRAGKVQVHYRAWASVQDSYYRTPEDRELAQSASSAAKAGLYAATSTADITVYESLPDCEGNICVSANFVDSDERFYDAAGFEAMAGKIYALEAEFTAQETDYLQTNVASDSNILFIGTQTGSFNFIKEKPFSGQSSAGAAVSVAKDSKTKLRYYFIAGREGAAAISLKGTGTVSSIEKNISFKVVSEKQLLIELSDSTVLLGKNFTVKVTDSGLKGVENALVKIVDKEGKVAKSVSGDGSDGKGKSGQYRIQNDMGTGLYEVQVSAPGYATRTAPLLVTTQNVLAFAGTIEAKIPVGQKALMLVEQLANDSEFSISGMTAEAEESEKFRITPTIVPAMGKGQKQGVQITVAYVGEPADSAEDSLTLTIKGFVEGKFLTQVSSKVHASYNMKLDQSCLKMEPGSVAINLIGTMGATDNETVEVTNNCDQALMLRARPVEKTKKSYVLVSAEDISLDAGETKNIMVTATNIRDRALMRDQSFSYEIRYDANYISKALPVVVRLVNPSASLACPGQITMFLAQNSAAAKAMAAQPLFITNISDFPVEGISFSVNEGYGSAGNVKVTVEPPGSADLDKRQAIMPPKLVVAQAGTKFSEPVTTQIFVRGRLGNLNNRSGQRDGYGYYDRYYNNGAAYSSQAQNSIPYSGSSQMNPLSYYAPRTSNYASASDILCTVNVVTYYSGFECLKVFPVDAMEYHLSLEGAQITKRIGIKNECSEPVRILGADTQSKEIFAALPQIIVSPGEQANVRMAVAALRTGGPASSKPVLVNVSVKGITEMSQTPIGTKNLPIKVYLGTNFAEQYSKAVKGVEVKLCGDDSANKEKIDVPKIASGSSADCANAYCDARQASKYIAGKVDQLIKKAQSQGYSKTDQTQTFGCEAQGYCTFGQLGVSFDPIDLYLQNDKVSAGALSDSLKDLASGNTGFRGGESLSKDYLFVEQEVNEETIGFIARAGYGNQVFIDRDLEGCGYYKITIDGAFNVSANQVNISSPVIAIRAMPIGEGSKIVTKECAASITNLGNFAPIDEGFKAADDRGTWLTTVDSEAALKEIGTEIAKAQFKDEERATSGGTGNKIRVSEAATAGNALAELCIGGDAGSPSVATLKVNAQIKGMTDPKEKSAFAKSIAKMAVDAINGSFGENCLVKSVTGHSCVRLTDSTGVGGLKMSVPNKTILLMPSGGCVSAKVTSSVPERISFEVAPFTADSKRFTGIRRIYIDDDMAAQQAAHAGQQGTGAASAEALAPAAGQAKSALHLYDVSFISGQQGLVQQRPVVDNAIDLALNQDSAAKGERFYRQIRICAEPMAGSGLPDEAKTAFYLASGSTFEVTAINKGAGSAKGTPPEDGRITISAGSLHPDDLVNLITFDAGKAKLKQRGEKNPYYFRVVWKEGPSEISFNDYGSGREQLGLMDKSLVKFDTGGLAQNPAMVDATKGARKSALLSYLGWCAGVSAVCNVKSLWATPLAVLADCGIPAAISVTTEDDVPDFLKTIKKRGSEFISSITGSSAQNVNEPISWLPIGAEGTATGTAYGVSRAVGKLGTALNAGFIDDSTKWLKESYVEGARKGLEKAMPAGTDAAKINAAAERYAELISERFRANLDKAYKEGLKQKTLGKRVAYDYGTIKGQALTEALGKAKADATSESFLKEFLNKGAASAKDKTTMLEFLTGIKPDSANAQELLNKLSGTSGAMKTAVDGADAASPSALRALAEQKVTRYADSMFDGSGQLLRGDPVPVPPSTTAAGGGVNVHVGGTGSATMLPGPRIPLTQDKIRLVVDDIARDMAAKNPSFMGQTIAAGGTMQERFVSDVLADIMSDPGVANYSKSQLVGKIEGSLDNVIKTVIDPATGKPLYAGLTKMTEAQIQDAAKGLSSMIDDEMKGLDDAFAKNPDELLNKRGFWRKVGELFKSPKFYWQIARGAGCGLLANWVGVQFYNKSIGASNEKITKGLTDYSCYTGGLAKGTIYKMTIAEDIGGKICPKLEAVTGNEALEREMQDALNPDNRLGLKGEWVTWDGYKLATKAPEERGLTSYMLSSNADALKAALEKSDYFAGKTETIKRIMERLIMPNSQNLIYKYSNSKSRDRIVTSAASQPDSKMAAQERMVAAIIVADWDASKVQAELTTPEKDRYYKDTITKLQEEMLKGDGTFTENIAKKVFSGTGSQAADVYNIYMAWYSGLAG